MFTKSVLHLEELKHTNNQDKSSAYQINFYILTRIINQAYYITGYSITHKRMRLEKQHSEFVGSLFINWMFPAALNLFIICRIIEYTNYIQDRTANFNLQIFMSLLTLYIKHDTLTRRENRNAENLCQTLYFYQFSYI